MDSTSDSDAETSSDEVTDLDAGAYGNSGCFYVATFAEKPCATETKPSSRGWAVKTKDDERAKGALSFKVILQPEQVRKLEDKNSTSLSSPYLDTCSKSMDEFCEGRPLLMLSTPVVACVGSCRPRVLYRVVHDGHSGDGVSSPGFGTIKTDSISFMMHLVNHFDSTCRDASPFMSATDNAAVAARLAKKYEREGFNNIKFLVITPSEITWPTVSRIWNVVSTLHALLLSGSVKKPDLRHEFLIEYYIPESCVRRYRWDAIQKPRGKRSKKGESRKRKRYVFEFEG